LVVTLIAAVIAGCASTLEDARLAAEKGRMDEAIEIWRTLAKEGNATAQLELARQYHQGEHVERDIDRAMELYRSAADGGEAAGAYWLGRIHHDARRVPRDHDTAEEWFARAAEMGSSEAGVYSDAYGGDADAQVELGLRTHPVLGEGATRERYALSWQWFGRAADQADRIGERFNDAFERLAYKTGANTSWNPVGEDVYTWTALGGDLDDGTQGLPQKRPAAGWWFRRSALTGNLKAQHRLALTYRAAKGEIADVGQAATWFRKSAEQGYAPAQYELAMMYAEGVGVGRNRDKAEIWMQKAARQGHDGARQYLNENE
jgi:TPR repeat protein